jgi:hypothetical protein
MKFARLQNELAVSRSKETLKEEDWTEGCDDTAFSVVSKANMSKFGPNTWLGDSGASSHYVNNDVGMFDVTVISEPIWKR